MILKYLLESLGNGDAFKRPSWRGYGFKTVVDEDTYTITMKNANGDTYVYTCDNGAWSAPSSALSLDAELFEGLFTADDWISGKAADFEAVRSGSGGVW